MGNSDFENVFKNIDKLLYTECDGEISYIEQTSWIMFLRYLDEVEEQRKNMAKLDGKKYTYIIDTPHRWSTWAVPKKSDGSPDINNRMNGDDLINFVRKDLFPYLTGFKIRADAPDTIEYKIGMIFSDIKLHIGSGYVLREILDLADTLHFDSNINKHELSSLYETRIQRMGNAGRNGGQYYTPRPLIRAMIKVINPEIGESIYDGSCGSCGFLCEAYDYLMRKPNKTTSDLNTLQKKTFYGKEKKTLAFIIGTMNMILHGIDAPNIIKGNTLSENIANIEEKDRFNVILTNPPFGADELETVQSNFSIKTSETAYLFLQHYLKSLKSRGRAAIVIKNTFLSNSDKASISLRKHLLETCNLHTILDLPQKTFQGAGVRTVVLFFEKGIPTKNIWYYQLDAGRNLGKTDPLNDDDLAEFIEMYNPRPESAHSWNITINNIEKTTFDLSVINPNKTNELCLRDPKYILNDIEKLDKDVAELLSEVRRILQ